MAKISKSALKYRMDDKCRADFSQAMEKGATKFGGLWLMANASAVDAIRRQGADPSDPMIKSIVAITVLRTLIHAKIYYKGAE